MQIEKMSDKELNELIKRSKSACAGYKSCQDGSYQMCLSNNRVYDAEAELELRQQEKTE